ASSDRDGRTLHSIPTRRSSDLPVRRNSYFDYVNSAPGISATSNVGQSSGAQSLGSSSNENLYMIDGTNISSTPWVAGDVVEQVRSEEHTSELQSRENLVCRLLL